MPINLSTWFMIAPYKKIRCHKISALSFIDIWGFLFHWSLYYHLFYYFLLWFQLIKYVLGLIISNFLHKKVSIFVNGLHLILVYMFDCMTALLHKGASINYVDRKWRFLTPCSRPLRWQVYSIFYVVSLTFWWTPLPFACLRNLWIPPKVFLLPIYQWIDGFI